MADEKRYNASFVLDIQTSEGQDYAKFDVQFSNLPYEEMVFIEGEGTALLKRLHEEGTKRAEKKRDD